MPGYEAIGSDGLGVPANTPPDIIDRLNIEVNAALNDPAIKARLEDLGGVPTPMSAAEYQKFVADEAEKWCKVAEVRRFKPE